MSAHADSVVAHSGESIAKGSKSFSGAAKLFDPKLRASVHMLYAWCRYCDDEIDGQHLGFAQAGNETADWAARHAALVDRTRRALAGEPTDDPHFAAVQRVFAAHAIPARHAFELLDGFAMDVSGRRYATIEDTLQYCYHVAGVVGVMMAMVMGARDPATLDRAADLGLAFQLTNIARDVVDDAKAGRIYLPGDWLAEAGVPAADIAAPAHRPALAAATARLLDTAEPYYASARIGLRDLPLRCAWAIATALGVYRDIGRVVRARGPRAWDSRAGVSGARKALFVGTGGVAALDAHTLARLRAAPPRDGLWTRPR